MEGFEGRTASSGDTRRTVGEYIRELEIADSFLSRFVRRSARQLLGHSAFAQHESDDLPQEIALHLLTKFSRMPAGTMLAIGQVIHIVKTAKVTLLRKRTSHRNGRGRHDVSLDESVQGHGDTVSLLTEIDDRARERHLSRYRRPANELFELCHDVRLVLRGLSKSDRKLLHLRRHNSELATGRILGWSRREVARELNRIAEILQRFDLDSY